MQGVKAKQLEAYRKLVTAVIAKIPNPPRSSRPVCSPTEVTSGSSPTARGILSRRTTWRRITSPARHPAAPRSPGLLSCRPPKPSIASGRDRHSNAIELRSSSRGRRRMFRLDRTRTENVSGNATRRTSERSSWLPRFTAFGDRVHSRVQAEHASDARNADASPQSVSPTGRSHDEPEQFAREAVSASPSMRSTSIGLAIYRDRFAAR